MSACWRPTLRKAGAKATASMRRPRCAMSLRDVTRERDTGKIVDGDADNATETTELWTFTRQNGADWKLSAIQQA